MKVIAIGIVVGLIVAAGIIIGGAMISFGWDESGLDAATGVGFDLGQGTALAVALMGAGAMFNWGQSVNK